MSTGEDDDFEDCWVGGEVYCDGNCVNWPIEPMRLLIQLPGQPPRTMDWPDESDGYVYPTHKHCNGTCM
jgi:hypothetical protein